MVTIEDISSLNDNEIESEKIFKIKTILKNNLKIAREMRLFKKISYLTRNTMTAYKNKLNFDITKQVLKKITFQPKRRFLLNKK